MFKPVEGVVLLRVNRPEARDSLSVDLRKQIVEELIRLDADKAVRAIQLVKEAALLGADAPLASGLVLEIRAIHVLFESKMWTRELFFFENRPPSFQGS